MINDSLGDRIKRYERASQHVLVPRSPLVIRVDGKAFHTWTRSLDRPFDASFIIAMTEAAQRTAKEMAGFKVGYVQSDEATFLLTDFDSYETQGWFGYELSKVVSVSASLFTAYFNHLIRNPQGELALFDSRAFTVPLHDAPNALLWRQRDWERNSVGMLARAHFSHRQLTGKSLPQVHDMLHGVGVNWARLPEYLKNGTFLRRDGTQLCKKLGYDEIMELIAPETEGAGE